MQQPCCLVTCALAIFFLSTAVIASGPQHVDIYKSLFDIKRREQIETAERVWNIDDYSKRYKSVAFVVNAIVPILEESLSTIKQAEYIPGSSPFPEEESFRDVLGKVYENVIFFGDFLLRMPDITKKVLKGHREWVSVLKEAMLFCNHSTDVYTGPHAKQLHLISQEIGLIPAEEGYVNPFSEDSRTKVSPENSSVKKDRHKKQYKTKGPKLRGIRQSKNEL